MMHSFIQRIVYPFTMVISVALFFLFKDADDKLLWATSVPVFFAIAVIVLFEKILPYKKEWQPNKEDLKTDAVYLIVIQTFIPKVLVWLTTLFVFHLLNKHNLTFNNLWPHHLPIGVQELMLVLISDLLRYWLHRFCHTYEGLWRFHAVHHSVEKMYWMNTSRFHPIEKALQFSFDVFPFMLLGVSPEVIGLHLVLYGVNGFFQHCNIDLKFGWLNFIVSSTEHHRWHHSRLVEESNNNYGNNVIVWDKLFGSYYNPNKELKEIGLMNRKYPQVFIRHIKAPFISHFDKKDLPYLSYKDILLNQLLKIKMAIIKRTSYRSFTEKTKHCEETQNTVLLDIIRENENTDFGKDHHFDKIKSYADFKKYVNVNDYESLRVYILKQEENQNHKAIINDDIQLFNKTSGTTAAPKLLPLTKTSLKNLKTNQQISSFIQYSAQPLVFSGKIVGIVSPAIESMSEHNIPIGSASGHFYKTMPFAVRSKYVVPHSVFEMTNYELKYYCILLLAIQHKDITFFGSANPTTFLKLMEILNERKDELLNDLRTKSIKNGGEKIATVIDRIKPTEERLQELEQLFATHTTLTYANLWPYIKMVTVWTGGSCGIALNSLLKMLPDDVMIYDPGYLASEMRGSITFDLKEQSGLMTYEHNFFEFVERSNFENSQMNFIQLHELKSDKEYYVFVTTAAGLYRYSMNDIIQVNGFVNECPLIKFIQKGKGVCSITGEKLYESQVIIALNQLHLNFVFVQFAANEESFTYECFIELSSEKEMVNKAEVAQKLDDLLCEQNMEYKEKRASNRIKCIEVKLLKNGTFNNIKEQAVAKGQNESQFKIMLLQYKKNLSINLDQFVY